VHVRNLARKNSLDGGGEHAAEKGRGGVEQRKKLRVVVWHGNRKSRWNAREYSEQENEVALPLLPLEPWAPCKARFVRAGAVIFASAKCSLQFAKASAATLLQQEKINSADVQRGRVHTSGFICTVVS
jgi:hypothetical protein